LGSKIKIKQIIISIFFWILLAVSFLSCLQIFRADFFDFNIKRLSSILSEINISILMEKSVNENPVICFEKYCQVMQKNKTGNLLSYRYSNIDRHFGDYAIKKISLLFKEEGFENKINSIFVSNGVKFLYFPQSELKNLPKKQLQIELSNNDKTINNYSAFEIPVNNYNGIYNHICILFLSLFYNWQLFIIPILGILFAVTLYIFKKEEIKLLPNISLSKKHIYTLLTLILLTGAFLRLNGFTQINFWFDEVYTRMIAIQNFKSCFQDAGNPPLFYILEYIVAKLTNYNDLALKIPSLICGISLPYITYLILNKINTRFALFGAFFVAINTINIYHSQELRSPALCSFLVMLSIYYLFEYLKNPNKKHLIIYTVIISLMLNTHYYLSFLVLGNFIWAIVDLIENKNKKEIKTFVIANFISLLTFLPYFLGIYRVALSSGFNAWIRKISIHHFSSLIDIFFLNKYYFIIFAIFFIFNFVLCFIPSKVLYRLALVKSFKKESLFVYLTYQIIFLFICVSFVSVYVKPIFHARIFLSCYSLFVLLQLICIFSVLKVLPLNRILKGLKLPYILFACFICLQMSQPFNLRYWYWEDSINKFIMYDSKYFIENGYEINSFYHDNIARIKNAPELKNINIKWHYLDPYESAYILKFDSSKYTSASKAVFYLSALSEDIDESLIYSQNAYVVRVGGFFSNVRLVYDKIKVENKNRININESSSNFRHSRKPLCIK